MLSLFNWVGSQDIEVRMYPVLQLMLEQFLKIGGVRWATMRSIYSRNKTLDNLKQKAKQEED
jgi:hypothetical protein